MNEKGIVDGLHQLGISAANARLVMLLPLVQVAWADDTVQAEERERILQVAREAGLLDKEGFFLLEGWLTNKPDEDTLELGMEILVALAHRRVGLGAEVAPPDLGAIVALCEEVAAAAGGIFGMAFSVSPEERSALAEIEDAMHDASERFLEQLPTPESGSLEEL